MDTMLSIEQLVQQDDLVVLSNKTLFCHYLYTIGNTNHNCPEFLIFCNEEKRIHYSYILNEYSNHIRNTRNPPESHNKFKFRQESFYPIQMDMGMVGQFAAILTQQYPALFKIPVTQLLLPDKRGHYPQDHRYDNIFNKQHILVGN
jgi:hypothetical protein